MVGVLYGRRCVWWAVCIVGGHAWQGACVARGVCGGGAWQMATETGSMHPTGMHSCVMLFLELVMPI